MRFIVSVDFDPETGLSHIRADGETEDEVDQVLRASGGDVQILYSPDEHPGDVFVIAVYELTGQAKRAYRRRRRRKPR